jgi:hypothetical protein
MSVAGLGDYDYLFSFAVDSGDPQTIIVSASQWPYKAYSLEDADHWFIEEHCHLLLMVLMIVTARIKNGS